MMTRKELLEKEMKLAEEYFGTTIDPEQIPINQESIEKLDKLCSGWLETEFDEKAEPVSWAVLMPTQRALAERFLNKEITERELLDMTKPEKLYNALYFVSAITLPEHRGRGLATKVLERTVRNMPITKDAMFFAWPFSKEGLGLVQKLGKICSRNIELRG